MVRVGWRGFVPFLSHGRVQLEDQRTACLRSLLEFARTVVRHERTSNVSNGSLIYQRHAAALSHNLIALVEPVMFELHDPCIRTRI